LAKARSTDSRHKIRGILNFVNGTLRSVRATETDPDLPSWYRRTSRVYVAANHQCWDDAKIAAKVNKSRFGRVKKSEEMTLNRMMATHREEACDWILDRVAEEEMVDEEG
jgi:histone deacetylase 6